MNITYSSNLADYDISFNNLTDKLVCVLDYNGLKWVSNISQEDLRSGMINLNKLMNVIKLNSPKTQPNYLINIELVNNERTFTTYLVLTIGYSNELIDFEEKIYFRQSNTTDDAVQSRQNQIILQQEKRIEMLEKKINDLENKPFADFIPIYIRSDNNKNIYIVDILDYLPCIDFINVFSRKCFIINYLLPKNINCINLSVALGKSDSMFYFRIYNISLWFNDINLNFNNPILSQNVDRNKDLKLEFHNSGIPFKSIFNFINLKKITINCNVNSNDNFLSENIVNFLVNNIIFDTSTIIEVNNNDIINLFLKKGYEMVKSK